MPKCKNRVKNYLKGFRGGEHEIMHIRCLISCLKCSKCSIRVPYKMFVALATQLYILFIMPLMKNLDRFLIYYRLLTFILLRVLIRITRNPL